MKGCQWLAHHTAWDGIICVVACVACIYALDAVGVMFGVGTSREAYLWRCADVFVPRRRGDSGNVTEGEGEGEAHVQELSWCGGGDGIAWACA